jgi:hypothetical protein
VGAGCGTFAEYCTVQGRHVVKLPDGISFTDAASFPTAGCTTYQALVGSGALRQGGGQRLLVLGGSSGTGAFALQLARAAGCSEVVATSSEVGAWRRVGRGRRPGCLAPPSQQGLAAASLCCAASTVAATATQAELCTRLGATRVISPRAGEKWEELLAGERSAAGFQLCHGSHLSSCCTAIHLHALAASCPLPSSHQLLAPAAGADFDVSGL